MAIVCGVISKSTADLSSDIRCSGDFSQYQQTKYCMSLPGLPSKVIDKLASSPSGLPFMTEAERAVAAQPGMFGRITFAQALAFDEAYQILMDPHSISLFFVHAPTVCTASHTYILGYMHCMCGLAHVHLLSCQ